MNVLALCHDPIWPADNGQRIRSSFLVESLQEAHSVSLLVPGVTVPVPPGAYRLLPCPARRRVRRRMAISFLTGASAFQARFADQAVCAAVAEAVSQRCWDLVLCNGLPMAATLPSSLKAPLWIDEQNLEWRIVERYSSVARWPMWLVARREAAALKAWEVAALARAHVITVCSLEDKKGLPVHLQARTHVLSNTCPQPPVEYTLDGSTEGKTLVYCGTMNWGPNIDAVVWFVNDIFPRIRARHSDAQFLIVGRDPARDVRRLQDFAGVHVLGTVPSVWPYLTKAQASVVPLRMGSGTRIKILESASVGLPCISTSLGAEGLSFIDGKEIILANTPNDFAQACCTVFENATLRTRIGRSARATFAAHYTRNGLAPVVRQIAADCATGSRSTQASSR